MTPKLRPREITVPDGLHPKTANLVCKAASALAAKLKIAQDKYGYADSWATLAWEAEAKRALAEHVAKGDPLDVMAYAAFIWARGWSTTPEAFGTPPDAAAFVPIPDNMDAATTAQGRAARDKIFPDDGVTPFPYDWARWTRTNAGLWLEVWKVRPEVEAPFTRGQHAPAEPQL